MREREVKLEADPAFRLPDLTDAVPGAKPGRAELRRVRDTYYDTADLRLLAGGHTLRFRAGEGWTVKIPLGRDERSLDREEIVIPGDPAAPPEAALAWVRAIMGEAPLLRVACFRTRRVAHPWSDAEGMRVLELTDDDVVADTFSRGLVRFREIEIELSPDADARLLEGLVARLLAAGARAASPRPKLQRALGWDSSERAG